MIVRHPSRSILDGELIHAYLVLIILWLLAVLLPPINNMTCWEQRTRGLTRGRACRGGVAGAEERMCGGRGAGWAVLCGKGRVLALELRDHRKARYGQ